MGHFSKACCISKINISGDHRIAVSVRRSNRIGERRTGVEHLLFFPIYGEYDGYGGIKNVESDSNVQHLEEFFGISADNIFKTFERVNCRGFLEYHQFCEVFQQYCPIPANVWADYHTPLLDRLEILNTVSKVSLHPAQHVIDQYKKTGSGSDFPQMMHDINEVLGTIIGVPPETVEKIKLFPKYCPVYMDESVYRKLSSESMEDEDTLHDYYRKESENRFQAWLDSVASISANADPSLDRILKQIHKATQKSMIFSGTIPVEYPTDVIRERCWELYTVDQNMRLINAVFEGMSAAQDQSLSEAKKVIMAIREVQDRIFAEEEEERRIDEAEDAAYQSDPLT